jgi:hypothetical protein
MSQAQLPTSYFAQLGNSSSNEQLEIASVTGDSTVQQPYVPQLF